MLLFSGLIRIAAYLAHMTFFKPLAADLLSLPPIPQSFPSLSCVLLYSFDYRIVRRMLPMRPLIAGGRSYDTIAAQPLIESPTTS
jgi:hypothetical protein